MNQSFISNPQISLQKNQTIKTEKKLVLARISLLNQKFYRLSEKGPENKSSSNIIFT